MAKKYKQGLFKPRNPAKYEGDYKNIQYRSSWELRCMNWMDSSQHIIKWSSEETIIPYMSPVDNKFHRYFIDFKIKVQTNSGIKVYLLEVKPSKEMAPPNSKNRRKSVYLNEVATYHVNQAKWKAADLYCKDRGWEFKVINEYDLGIKK